MAHIEGRKYEVTLPDGRIVSRQRASQLRNPQPYKQRNFRWSHSEAGREKRNAASRRWYAKKRLEDPEYFRDRAIKRRVAHKRTVVKPKEQS